MAGGDWIFTVQGGAALLPRFSTPVLHLHGTAPVQSSGQAPKPLGGVGKVFWGLGNDQLKASTIPVKYTMVTSQGLLWSWRIEHPSLGKQRNAPGKSHFPCNHLPPPFSPFLLFLVFKICRDWGYFLPDYRWLYKKILPLQRCTRKRDWMLMRAMENSLFYLDKNAKWRQSFALKDLKGDLWKSFYLEVTQNLLWVGTGATGSNLTKQWLVLRDSFFR